MSRRCLWSLRATSAAVCAVLASAATPAAALGAPTVAVDRPCLSTAAGVTLTGDGFTPGAGVTVTAAYLPRGGPVDAGSLRITADANGHISHPFNIPQQTFDPIDFRIVARDETLAAQGLPAEASTMLKATGYGVFFAPWNTNGPAIARPGRRGKLEILGFVGTVSRRAYVHYVLRGRPVKTRYLGRLRGPCGTLTVRRFKQFDFRPLPAGTYRIVIDTYPQYRVDGGEGSGFSGVIVRRRDARP